MKVISTGISDLNLIVPSVFEDERGFFFEAFNEKEFVESVNFEYKFVQDNQSHSKRGTIRGLHYQEGSSAQSKLVRVLSGEILDVAVDLRRNSETFGKVFSVTLSACNKKQLLIPKGFAHGFSVLSESADVLYKCDSYYDPKSEAGIYCFDKSLGIDWLVDEKNATISEKDRSLPLFKNVFL